MTYIAVALATAMFGFKGVAHAQPTAPADRPVYRVKPSDVAVPQDVPLGQYQRIFRPFKNWTLICDENLKVSQRVCNVSQSITDASGTVVFSWSLTAAEGGQPFFILRTTPDIDARTGIRIRIEGVKEPLKAAFDGCNKVVCLGNVPVSAVLSDAIRRGSEVTVGYRTQAGEIRSIQLPLQGLDEAVTSIGGGSAASQQPRPAAKPEARNTNRLDKAPAAKKDAGKLSVPPRPKD